MEKSCRKSASKASPRPLFYFENNPKQLLHARSSFKNKLFWTKIIKNLFFWTQPLLIVKVIKNKRGLELVTSSSSSYETSSETLLY